MKVALIGGGVIGAGWAARLSLNGIDVTLCDPDPQAERWLGLRDPARQLSVAFQPVPTLPRATWPEGPVPQQLHLDLTVTTKADLDTQHDRALALGAQLLEDLSDDPEEPLRVYADPAGHPFCIFVAPPPS